MLYMVNNKMRIGDRKNQENFIINNGLVLVLNAFDHLSGNILYYLLILLCNLSSGIMYTICSRQ